MALDGLHYATPLMLTSASCTAHPPGALCQRQNAACAPPPGRKLHPNAVWAPLSRSLPYPPHRLPRVMSGPKDLDDLNISLQGGFGAL